MSSAGETTGLRVEVRGPVLLVTIDRPHVRHAVDNATAWHIAAAMDRLDDDPALFVGILTGGGRFSLQGRSEGRAGIAPLPGRGLSGSVRGPRPSRSGRERTAEAARFSRMQSASPQRLYMPAGAAWRDPTRHFR